MRVELLGYAVDLGEPRALWLLATAPLLVMAVFRSGSGRRAAGLVTHTSLRLLVLVALAAAIARPTIVREADAVSLVGLFDVSESVPDRALEEARARWEEILRAAEAAAAPPTLRAARFAGRIEALPQANGPPGRRAVQALPRFRGPVAQESDLPGAVAFALGLLDPDRIPRLVLFSDGGSTRGGAERVVAEAARRGARLFVVPLAGEAPAPDVAVVNLEAPDTVRPNAPFELGVRLEANATSTARITLFKNGAPDGADAARDVQLPPGETVVSWRTTVDGSAVTTFRAELAAGPSNARAENDRGSLAIRPASRPRVLVVEAVPGSGRALRNALVAAEMEVDVARSLPTREALEGAALVVLADVPSGRLSPAEAQTLDHFVREAGGGLVVAAGPQSAATKGYEGTKLGALLPLSHEETTEREEPTLALALVIDRSGSMSGPKMELTKEAARGAAETMAPEDLITVVVFDSQAHTVVRLQPASNRQRILSDIAQIRASGGTNVLPGLRDAIEQLLAVGAKKKHVIVLSDGQSPAEGVQELVDEAAAARITVSAVGVGDGADLSLLQAIASRGGGRFYQTRDPASIPRIFTRETAQFSRPAAEEAATRVRALKQAAALSGIPIDRAPPLRGHTRTRPKKGAELLLGTDLGDPLLARWQVGLGQVVMWTSDVAGGWAGDWARWKEFPKFWAQVARSALGSAGGWRVPVQAHTDGDHVVVQVDALGPDGQPRPGLVGTLELRAVEGGPSREPVVVRRLPLAEPSPGRYEARLLVDDRSPILLTAALADSSGTGVAVVGEGRLPAIAGREFEVTVGSRRATRDLEALAARTGGGRLRDPASLVAAGSDRAATRVSIAPELFLLAGMFFLVEVALRRATLRASRSTGRGAAW